MSLTKKTESKHLQNPAYATIKFSADTDPNSEIGGHFYYYDKNLQTEGDSDKVGGNVILDNETEFFILDHDLISITGWDDDRKRTIQSNEVRSMFDDELVVKGYTKGKDRKNVEELIRGVYVDIKEEVKNLRGKFTRGMYVMIRGDDRLFRMQFTGAAYSAWLDQIENKYRNRMHDRFFSLVEVEEKKKGKVKYFSPFFEFTEEPSAAEMEEYSKVDGEVLQPYLESYFSMSVDQRDKLRDESSESESETKDLNWRQVQYEGRSVGSRSYDQILDLKSKLEKSNETNHPAYAATKAASAEFQDYKKNWRNHTTTKGVPLVDFTQDHFATWIEQLQKKDPEHKVKLLLEAAYISLDQEKKLKEPDNDPYYATEEDDDIPF